MPPASKTPTTDEQPDAAASQSDNPTNAPDGDDYELVYVCNPQLHGKDADKRPVPGRVSRLWLTLHADAGWVACDANGKEL